MFSKSTLGIWLDSKSVQLVLYKKDRERKLVHSSSLDEFLRRPAAEKYRSMIDNVAIVIPDDWVTRTFFPFHSPKKKYIKPFLQRQLKRLTDQDENLHNYHHYYLGVGPNEEKGIYVYYLTRRDALQVKRNVDASGFNISMITTPGLLWGEKLKGIFRKKDVKNIALLIYHEEECHLFLYHQRSFTFSRRFDLSEYTEKEEAFRSLVFEITQSFIYFSQQFKSEVELLTVIDSSGSEDLSGRLEDAIDKEVMLIGGESARSCSGSSDQEAAGNKIQYWIYFCESDFLDTARAPNLLPENELKNVCYSCFQRAGIVVGGVLFLIFMVQVCWMQVQYISLSKQLQTQTKPVESLMESTLNEWSDAADAIIDKARRPSVSRFLGELARIDVPYMHLNRLEFDMEGGKLIKLEGVFNTEDARIFKTGIETLMNKIESDIPSVNGLGWQNVTFQRNIINDNTMGYRFRIRINL